MKNYELIVEESRKIIKKYFSKSSIVMWSGGKDSTALLILVKEIFPSAKVLYEKNKYVEDHVEDILDFLTNKYGKIDVVESKYSWYNLPPSPVEDKPACSYWLKIEPGMKFIIQNEVKTLFLGDRKDENSLRRRKLSKYFLENEIEFEKIKFNAVYPLKDWTSNYIIRFLNSKEKSLLKFFSQDKRTSCLFAPYKDYNKLKENHPLLFTEISEFTGTNNLHKNQCFVAQKTGLEKWSKWQCSYYLKKGKEQKVLEVNKLFNSFKDKELIMFSFNIERDKRIIEYIKHTFQREIEMITPWGNHENSKAIQINTDVIDSKYDTIPFYFWLKEFRFNPSLKQYKDKVFLFCDNINDSMDYPQFSLFSDGKYSYKDDSLGIDMLFPFLYINDSSILCS